MEEYYEGNFMRFSCQDGIWSLFLFVCEHVSSLTLPLGEPLATHKKEQGREETQEQEVGEIKI